VAPFVSHEKNEEKLSYAFELKHINKRWKLLLVKDPKQICYGLWLSLRVRCEGEDEREREGEGVSCLTPTPSQISAVLSKDW
jgi:hypothetical protein